MTLQPRRYQDFAAYWLARRGGGILGDEVGLGKTFTASLACQILKAKKVLIIAPKRLLLQWAQELQKYEAGQVHVHDLGTHFEVEVYNPSLVRTYVLTNYEKFQFENGSKTPKASAQSYLNQSWCALILDEVHNIKNRKAQRTLLIKRLITKVKIGLTGTPIGEKIEDLWSLIHWLNPKGVPPFWTFVNLYCETEREFISGATKIIEIKQTKVNGKWSKHATLKLLADRVKDYLLVRRLVDVGLELPEKTIVNIPIELGTEQRAFYQKVKKQIVIELTEDFGPADTWDLTGANKLIIRSAASRFLRLLQCTSAPTVFGGDTTTENSKLEWVEEFLNNNPNPVLIMTRFRHTADLVNKLLAKLGRDDCMAGTTAALGTGFNLQRFNYMVLVDAPTSLLENTQVEGRIHRSGQTKPTFIYRLSAVGSIDDRAWGLINGKGAESDLIMEWLRGLRSDTN